NTWRDNILFHAFRNHRERLIAELRDILPRHELTFDQACGAILLAGYLAAPELSFAVVRCVENSNGNWRLLPEAIWAVGRSGGEDVHALLDRLFVLLQDVSNEKDQHGWSPRHSIVRAFGDMSPRTFPAEVVAHIIRRAEEQPKLQDVLFPLIHAMDLPVSLEHLARHKAAQVSARGKTEVSRIDFFFSRWDPSNDLRFVRPSDASRDRCEPCGNPQLRIQSCGPQHLQSGVGQLTRTIFHTCDKFQTTHHNSARLCGNVLNWAIPVAFRHCAHVSAMILGLPILRIMSGALICLR
ncbi:MAG: hypothetical protein DME33_15625, partial [Verrucomicrobia bacterium]